MIESRKRRWDEEDAEEERLWKRHKQHLLHFCAAFMNTRSTNAPTVNGRRQRTGYMRPKYYVAVLGRKANSGPFLQHLLNSGPDTTDANFVAAFALDKEGFCDLVGLLVPAYNKYILYSKGSGLFSLELRRNNRGKPREVTCAMMTALLLSYLRRRKDLLELQPLCGFSLSTINDWVRFGLVVACEELEHHPDCAFQKYPIAQEREIMQAAICICESYKFKYLIGTFALLDGCKFGLQQPLAHLQERFYNGWLHKHCINNLIMFFPAGDIIYAVYDFPGTTHDQAIFDCSHLTQLLEDMDQDDGLTPTAHRHNVISDVGFNWYEHFDVAGDPRSKTIKGRLRRVRKANESQPREGVSELLFRVQRAYEQYYFRDLTAARQGVERGNGPLQKLWERLATRLPANMSGTRHLTIAACLLLLNFRVRWCGHLGTQISSVYGLEFV